MCFIRKQGQMVWHVVMVLAKVTRPKLCTSGRLCALYSTSHWIPSTYRRVQSDDKTRAVSQILAHNVSSLCQHHYYWHTRWLHTNVVESGRTPRFVLHTRGLGDVYTNEEHLVILLVVGIDVGVWVAFWNKGYNLESLSYTQTCSRYDSNNDVVLHMACGHTMSVVLMFTT